MDFSTIIKYLFYLIRRHFIHVTIVMAKPTAEQYYEAFKKSYLKLKDVLPISHLLSYLFKADVVHGYLEEKLNVIAVRGDKGHIP